MSIPDWTQAPTEATHYDTYADCFCDVNGWWRMDRYQLLKNQNEWGTSRYVPRPVKTTVPDWTKSPKGATRYDHNAGVFCNAAGWWDNSGKYWATPQNSAIEYDRRTVKPKDPAPSNWVDGWPPVGWNGELRWGGCTGLFECVVLPGQNVALQGSAGNWNIVNDLKEYDYEFRDVQSEENSTANSDEWDGTGFPPVGTKCEVLDRVYGNFNRVEITAVSRDHLVAIFNDEEVLLKKNCPFRQIHTEAQNESADLEDFIEKAISAGLKTKGIASGIIEKGYRLVKD
jgi:hypothetical protein